MIRRKFYEQLGLLLYAVVKSDGRVQGREMEAVDREIHHMLDRHPGFEKPDNAALKELMLTKINFHHAMDQVMSVHNAEASFEGFMGKYGKQIHKIDRKFALDLLRHVALSYGGMRAVEQRYVNLLLADPSAASGK